jgi:hypothetical protein
MSDFSVPVVKLGTISKHPNADTISITEVEGCPVIVRTTDFKEGDLAVYIPVESLIPEDREWVKTYCSHLKFKNGVHRLKAVRLRQIFSMGMLVPIGALGPGPTPGHGPDGTDVSLALGITKYEEPEATYQPEQREKKPKTLWQRFVSWARKKLGLVKKPIPRLMPVYEINHYRKHKAVLTPGEEIVATEKIHGCNAALCFTKGRLWVSSHRVMRPVEDDSIWWRAARQYNLVEKLAKWPDVAFYGEVYGSGVQDMEYGLKDGEIRLAIFDIMHMPTREFRSHDDIVSVCRTIDLPTVPVVYRGPYDPAVVEPLSDGPSTIAGHFREGIVIRPVVERRHPALGRVVLKLVGETYLLRKNGTEKH